MAKSFISHRRRSLLVLPLIFMVLLLRSLPNPDSIMLGRPGTTNIDLYKPLITYSDRLHSWIPENQRTIHGLFLCMEAKNCAQNQTKVIVLASPEFIENKKGGYVSGENIWAFSTVSALQNMGYTMVYAESTDVAVTLYHILDPLVEMVIFNPDQAFECFNAPLCVRSEENPAGIPAWRIFSFCFWSGLGTALKINPLGDKWSLSPEDYPGREASYVGYSIEAQCHKQRHVPKEQRKHQAYILGKRIGLFSPQNTAWAPELYDAAATETGIAFIAAAYQETRDPTPKLSKAITNLLAPGQEILSQDKFYDHLAHSKVLVGLGDPVLSPTPYDALCLGVPFINVIRSWDRTNPADKSRWAAQHGFLKRLDPPYVYNVFAGDRKGFVDAVKSAVANPIESYIVDAMRISAVEKRLGELLQRNWRSEAIELLEQRRSGRESGPLFHVE
ncbi:hypothetical protein MIND_00445300 [Mycena indigotica]|uniref:Glycosyltransferase family 18 catalytic domain-containing protein n=1 Tax=Mycena indigotica TaxID=2126181 RepID=A0A8H6SWR0_9AGAR|nr:uncharacterized protein MIND_00445300 [Mycena indigotica]KAF7306540.1 hypothetical protein MIND_00445300 [Mycena indigotica]